MPIPRPVGAPSFADLFDDALAQARAAAARSASWSAADAPGRAADPFLFARPCGAGAAWTRAYPRPAGAWNPGAPPHRETPPRPGPGPERPALPGGAPGARALPPARPLTLEQRRALDELLALGAALTEAFTADDLRREYRRLALALHPDRHAQATPDERVRLGEAFARVSDAYRRLRDVAQPRH